jgi:regulator of sigma E protease
MRHEEPDGYTASVSYVLAALIVGLLILLHESGHYLVAKLSRMRVVAFSIGFGPAIVKWRPEKSETTFQISAIPLGGYVQIAGMDPQERADAPDPRRYDQKPLLARLGVIAAGPLTNFLTAAVAYGVLFGIGFPSASNDPVLGEVPRGKPAYSAGLREGDRVLTVNDRGVRNWEALAKATGKSRGKALRIRVRRGHDVREFVVRGHHDRRAGRWLIGIAPKTEYEYKRPVAAVLWGFKYAAFHAVALFYQLGSSLFGSGHADFMGPVGIVEMAGEQVHRGLRDVLLLVAGLSIGLFGLNFLPLPALDGGRLVFLGYEAVMRKRVPPRFEYAVHAIGLVFLLGVLAIVTFRDILLAGS